MTVVFVRSVKRKNENLPSRLSENVRPMRAGEGWVSGGACRAKENYYSDGKFTVEN